MDAICILYVADLDRSRRFYAAVLDAEPVLDVPGMKEFRLTEGATLGLMPERGIAKILGDAVPHPEKGAGIPRCEVYLRVEDPEAWYRRALDAGATDVDALRQRSWGELAAYVADPDGHVLAFACPVPAPG